MSKGKKLICWHCDEEGHLRRYKYRVQDGIMKVSKGAIVVMKAMLLEGLYVLQSKVGSTLAIKWTLEEKYLDVLEHERVNQCKECTMVGKSSKSLARRYVAFDETTLTKQCKSASQVKVELCGNMTS
ncbi:hypothetical protein CRG98_017666 [Punica granatum]|uniref:Uncharacterized protein n=1 Tax=Punica granatum TaxID=22663 RepID=A0A2I0K1G0_PUNGR|nr:hypothetical protein CRG98_017666 [Punica granatum]